MAHGYSSPDEESVLGKAEIYAEIYGTPPSRLQGNKPHKRQPAGSQRKLKPAGRKDKQARQQGCAAKQKARLDARAFKELDTTLQVLGIDGATPQNAQRVTASTHAPLVAQESPRLHRSGSSRGEFYLERSGSDQQLSDSGRRHSGPSRHHSMSSPCPSAPPSVPTSPKRAISQPAPTPGYRRSPSTDVLGRPETRKLVRLESERQEWHAVLDNLLNGNFAREDLDLAVSIARSKAEDLKEQLIWWQTPPEASWPAREERLNWLELALQEAKDISAGLKRHGVVVEEEGHITYLHDCLQIIRDALREVRGLVGICCDAIAEGMRSLGGTVDETKRGFRAVHRVVSISQKLASNLKTATWTQLQPLEGPQAEAAQHSPDAELLQLSRDLGGSAFEVVVAALEATGNLQESVLCDKALLPGLGASSSAHEVSVQAKLLQSSWQACGELVDMIMQGWPALRLDITREWCKLFLRAAQLADGMQHKARMTQRSSSLASLDAGAESDGTGGPCTSGVWGNYCGSPVTQPATNGAVGDDDLQAQAWLPAMLSSLLTQAEKSANAIARQLSYPVAEEAGADGKQPAASEVDERIEALLDELSDAFYDLAYTGTHRVARMCRAPEPLACWALELLEEQACQAVVFVRDLDKSLLGQGEHALHHYETLRRCTDTLVNAILRVRRLLKQRRSDSECNQDPPRPIPRNDSHISLGQSSAVSSPLSSRPATPPMAIPSANSPAASTDGRANQTAALPPAHPVGPRPDPPAWGSFKPLKTGRGAAPEGRPHSPALFPAGSAYRTIAAGMDPRARSPSVSPAQQAQQRSAQRPPLGQRQHSPFTTPARTSRPSRSGQATGAQGPPESATPTPAVPVYSPQVSAWVTPRPAQPFGRSAVAGASAPQSHQQASPSLRGAPTMQWPRHQRGMGRAASQAVSPSPFHDRRGAAAPPGSQPARSAQGGAESLGRPNSSQPWDIPAPAESAYGAADYSGGNAPSGHHRGRHRHRHRGRHHAAANGAAPHHHQHPQRPQHTAGATPQQAQHPASTQPEHTTTSSKGPVPAPVAAGAQAAIRPGRAWKDVLQFGGSAAPPLPATLARAQPTAVAQPTRQPPTAVAQPASSGTGAAAPARPPSAGSASGPSSRTVSPSPFSAVRDASPPRHTHTQQQQHPAPVQQQHAGPPSRPASRETSPAFSQRPAGGTASREASPAGSQRSSPIRPPPPQHLPPPPQIAGPAPASPVSSPVSTPTAPVQPHPPPPQQPQNGADNRTQNGAADSLASSATSDAPLACRPSSEANSVAEDVNNGVVSSNGCELSTSPLKAKLNLPWENDPFWQVKWEDLKPTLIKKLGSGSFGQVYEAYYHSAPMAVKILTIDVNSGIEGLNRTLRRFKDEVDLQRRLSLHPNIVRFLGAACQIPISLDSLRSPTYAAQGFMQGMTLAIIMELCRFGNLFKLIEVARRVARLPPSVRSAQQPPRSAEEAKLKASPGWKLFSSWPIRLELARQAAAAVEFLHSHGVVHRDLTSYNLLVTDKWEAKVCDFNLARAVRETEMVAHSGSINSPEWSAPERLAGQAYGRSADVFSFGVVVWELITLGVPWHEDDDDEGSSSSESGGQFRDPFFFVMQSVPRGSRLVFPAPDAVCPSLPELPQVIALVQECWAQKPCERPTMALVCKRLECILGAVRGRLREEHRRRLP